MQEHFQHPSIMTNYGCPRDPNIFNSNSDVCDNLNNPQVGMVVVNNTKKSCSRFNRISGKLVDPAVNECPLGL